MYTLNAVIAEPPLLGSDQLIDKVVPENDVLTFVGTSGI
jgi:hypothetical protein